jgi:membrane protein implicated in regulation of membrane protease activity
MNARLFIAIISNIIWELLIVAALVWGLPRLGINTPPWGIVLIAVAFAVYSVLMYRLGIPILRKKALPGSTDMIGVQGKVARRLAPAGLISIEGELWEAEAENGTIEAGVRVVVVSQKGFKLVVAAR